MSDYFPEPGSFNGKPAPLGIGQITIDVGGIAINVAGIQPILLEPLQERYAPFVTNAPPNHRVMLEAGSPRYLDHAAGALLRLEERQDGGAPILVSHNFAARRKGKLGLLRLSAPADAEDSLMAIENYLRWSLADLALDRSGFIFHAAGLARNGRAYVFFGPSGAGKSTVVSLSPGYRVLSDDLVLLVRGERGWRAATTPFKGTFPQGAKDRGTYSLRGLYRLVQAPANAVAPVPLGLAVGMAMACCPFVSDPAKRRDKLLPLVESCCREAGVRELRFRREAGFWDIIAR